MLISLYCRALSPTSIFHPRQAVAHTTAWLFSALLWTGYPAVACASDDGIKINTGGYDDEGELSWAQDYAVVPFAFYTDNIGFALGMAGVVKGVIQPQASLFGAGLKGNKGTWLTYMRGDNFRVSNDSRWLFGAEIYNADFQQTDFYLGEAASNDSAALDAFNANAYDARYRLFARYIFPLGSATANPLAALALERPLTGSTPWQSGITSLEFRPYYQSRRFHDSPPLPDTKFADTDEVWALETRLEWDNLNSEHNPSQGSHSLLTVTTDPGGSERESWWQWELSQSWFWDIGPAGDWFDQQVIAFNAYVSDVPSWNQSEQVNGQTRYHRPPEFARASLGGLFRLRSYPGGRFSDRSALSYSMEYRVMPEWQPLSGWPVFDWYDVPWWQWVLFTDLGRVADEFDLAELNRDMRWSAGGAVRFQVEGVVVRAEMAWGEEQSSFNVMVNQPF
ncbi:BamA/TamA family outer membrane protein [Photobacterium salinisoli]|uniref:BamA/TamA family outer membrane protein n=1 Tax=Photobacterium salinisoli TaxID=1616783 RepID=UPI000EA02AF0|nr:BamA/TamA family outer membrane protein [Photobacterium salinisoli]